MTVRSLPSDIKTTGINQDSLVTLLNNLVDQVNECKTAVNSVITAATTAESGIQGVTPVTATDLTLLKA